MLRNENSIMDASLKNYKRNCVIIKRLEKNGSVPKFESFAAAYHQICGFLNKRYGLEASRTDSENMVAKMICKQTRLDFVTSCWIGNFNVDIFFPQIAGKKGGGRRLKGLAIEVNGGIHNHELKIRKDNAKAEFLHHLGIGYTVIENDDVFHVMTKQEISKLRDLPRLDSRARKRLIQTIYLATIAYHATEFSLTKLFQQHSGTAGDE